MPRSARRRSAPSSPAKTRNARASPQQIRRSNRTQSTEADQTRIKKVRYQRERLDSVEELSDTIVVNKTRQHAVNTKVARPSILAEVDNRDSSLSSVTFSNGFSDADEYANLDKDLIIDNLTAINHDAEKILSLLSTLSTDVISHMPQSLPPTIYKRVENFTQRLYNDVEPYGRGPRIFLPTHRLQQFLINHDLPTSGAVQIFLKANLAIFASNIVTGSSPQNSGQVDELVQFLTLPGSFRQAFGEADNTDGLDKASQSQALSLGISLLTQSVIRNAEVAQEQGGLTFEQILKDTFWDEDDWRHITLTAASPIKANIRISARFRELMKHSRSGSEQIADFDALRKSYSWSSFVRDSIAWSIRRGQEIEESILNEGGVDEIQSSLSNVEPSLAWNTNNSSKSTRKSKEREALVQSVAFLRQMEANLDAPNELEEQSSEQELHVDDEKRLQYRNRVETLPEGHRPFRGTTISESPQATEEHVHVVRQRRRARTPENDNANDVGDFVDNDHQSERDLPTSAQDLPEWFHNPTQETLEVLQITQRQQKESNKENSPPSKRYGLLDRQPDAARISFSDDRQPSDSRTAKRSHKNADITDDNDDDDDFEIDMRQAKRPRHDSGKATASRRQAEKSREHSIFLPEADDSEAEGETKAPEKITQAATQSSRSSSSQQPRPSRNRNPGPSTVPPASSYEEYAQVQRDAKINLRFASLVASQQRAPQNRKAWTEGEIQCLMDLMSKYGTSWAKIKEADRLAVNPMLKDRNQVQLKDKARNMKMDFLKAEQPLPEYFEAVTISKSHKELLSSMNIGFA